MSTFYGTVEGMAETCATRRGSDFIRASAQSWDGSVVTRLRYDDNEVLMININLDDDSDCYGSPSLPSFYGTLDELKEMFTMWNSREIVQPEETLADVKDIDGRNSLKGGTND